MKARRLFLYVALVLLAILLVGVPAQAGSGNVTTFYARLEGVSGVADMHETGGVEHWSSVEVDTWYATDPRVEGEMTSEWKCIALPSHPYSAPPDVLWGPCNVTWRLVVVKDEDGNPLQGTGWAGVFHLSPQQDPWKHAWVFKGVGQGFGSFKGMTVAWDIPAEDPPDDFWISGRIIDNSK